jgi:anti-sigma B factor antagonist
MTQLKNQTTAYRSAGIEILGMPEELDLVTADGLVEQGYAAIARRPRLLLLDLARLSFCDARGLSAFVRIANQADAAGCRYRLIAARAPVAKMLRIGALNRRLPVFATIDDALADLTAIAKPGRGETGKPPSDCSPSPSVSIPRPARFLAAARNPGARHVRSRPSQSRSDTPQRRP